MPDPNEKNGEEAKESLRYGGLFVLRSLMTVLCMFVSSSAGVAMLLWVHYLLGIAKNDGIFDQLRNIDGHNVLGWLEAAEGMFAAITILGFAFVGAIVGWKEQWRIGTGRHESGHDADQSVGPREAIIDYRDD